MEHIIQKPDYDNSILGITASVLKHYGYETKHKSLPVLDEALSKNYKNVVVLLFDGMGIANLEQHLGKESFLRKNMKATISSTFPPTTTAATTTMESGLAPIEHGWLGWDLYFKELSCDGVTLFLNNEMYSNKAAADYPVAHTYIPYKSIYSKIKEASNGKVIATSVSPFAENRVESKDELYIKIKELCEEEGRHYIYSYWPNPDSIMHQKGCDCQEVYEDIMETDCWLEKLVSELQDTLIIVTADHGHINNKVKFLEDYPQLMETLLRLPSIEPRALSCFVKSGRKEEFKEEFYKAFGDQFLLMTREEVFEHKLFGPGIPHDRINDFIGDFLAVAIGDIYVIPYHIPQEEIMLGIHAGMTKREMEVPLIIIER